MKFRLGRTSQKIAIGLRTFRLASERNEVRRLLERLGNRSKAERGGKYCHFSRTSRPESGEHLKDICGRTLSMRSFQRKRKSAEMVSTWFIVFWGSKLTSIVVRRLKGSFLTYLRRPKYARCFGDLGVQKVKGIPENNKNRVEVIVAATDGEVYTLVVRGLREELL